EGKGSAHGSLLRCLRRRNRSCRHTARPEVLGAAGGCPDQIPGAIRDASPMQPGHEHLYRSLTSSTRASKIVPRWLPVMLAVAAVLTVSAAVITLRWANDGPEPSGQNWWLAAELVVAMAYLTAGVALVARREQRLLGALFMVVATGAL